MTVFSRDRPLGVPELFDQAFGHYRRNARKLMSAGGVLLFPAGIALGLGQIVYQASVTSMTTASVAAGDAGISSLAGLFVALTLMLGLTSAYSLVSMFARGVLITAAMHIHAGEEFETRQVLGETWHRAPALLLTEFLVGLAVGVATLFFLVPGIIVGVFLSLSAAAVIIEGRSLFDALGRSFELVTGRWWRVFGIVTALGILSLVLQSIVTTPAQLLFLVELARRPEAMFSPSGNVLASGAQSLLAAVAVVFVSPLTALVMTGLFVDLRLRRTGEDLEAALDEQA